MGGVSEDRLITALDFSELAEAEKLVKRISPLAKIFKIGKELFTTAGPDAVRMVHSYKCRVFLDLKFHDIPNTVASACEAAAKLGVFMLNVHALGGRAMMAGAAEALRKTEEGKRTKILGVTVLTSMTDGDLKEVGVPQKVEEEVERLAMLAKTCGLHGVVASGQEIVPIRKAAGKDFLIVTPGVRPLWAAHGDQKRVVTPREAIDLGADYVVVGRPITRDSDPLAAAEKILQEISKK